MFDLKKEKIQTNDSHHFDWYILMIQAMTVNECFYVGARTFKHLQTFWLLKMLITCPSAMLICIPNDYFIVICFTYFHLILFHYLNPFNRFCFNINAKEQQKYAILKTTSQHKIYITHFFAVNSRLSSGASFVHLV